MELHVISLGASISAIRAPDKEGNLDDVVLGYDRIEGTFRGTHFTVKLLISTRAAINSRRALDPAAIGGRRLLEVYN